MEHKTKIAITASALALAIAAPAVSQESDDGGELRQNTVVVTGSFIQGTPEDAALPVDVIDAGDLELQGSPQITDIIRNLGVSSGADGQTNQFSSNGLEGTANINLRGLGAGRTLVLLNGKRQTFSPREIGEQAQLFVDTNMIPSAAIQRIEILKDGAAALYGSDAIAGVVNFITNDRLEGLELSADYEYIDGSEGGNYNLSAAYGLQFDKGSWITSVGYNVRNELPNREQDFVLRSFEENPQGGFSTIGNPGSFVAIPNVGPGVAAAGTPLAFANSDDQCNALGGVDGGVLCRFQFTQFGNVIEREERFQAFSEFNYEFGGVDFHLEALYGNTEVPEWNTSPSFPPQALFGQVILPDHPGLVQFLADNPDFATATFTDFSPLLAGGAPIPGGLDPATTPLIFFGRTFGVGGFPLNDGEANEGSRTAQTYRIAGDVSGEWENGVNWNFGVNYSSARSKALTPDTTVFGLQQALLGLGGDNCDGTTPGQNGCLFYNPFSNAIAVSSVNGATNPQFDPALANSEELADFLVDQVGDVNTTALLTVDATFSGQSGFELPGGSVGWAAGVQFRNEQFSTDPNDVADLALNPCVVPGDVLDGNGLCPDGSQPTGQFAFLAGGSEFRDDQNIFGTFVELQLPILDNLDVQLAARYESYQQGIGDTLDPKVAANWQVTPEFNVRGSFQTSFKGPTVNQIDPGVSTTLQFIAPTGAFRAVDQGGNPELSPESATSFNVGGVFQAGGLYASIDYYNFNFEDTIIVESQDAIVAAAIAALSDPDAPQGIINRITFDGGVPAVGTISRIRANIVNGPDIETSGIDFRADYTLDDVVGGEFSLGGDATYVLDYDVGEYNIEDITVAGFSGAGSLNRDNFARPIPEWKANFFANYARGIHNLRADVRFISEYDDPRAIAADANGDPFTIDSFTTIDLTYNLDLTDRFGFRGFVSAQNVLDQDPPLARLDLSYDPNTHNPFGRVLKVGGTYTWGAN